MKQAGDNTKVNSFIASIKESGVSVTREAEIIERLSEVNNWQFAFTTLAKNGKSIGISFLKNDKKMDMSKVRALMDKYGFSSKQEEIFENSLSAA